MAVLGKYTPNINLHDFSQMCRSIRVTRERALSCSSVTGSDSKSLSCASVIGAAELLSMGQQ